MLHSDPVIESLESRTLCSAGRSDPEFADVGNLRIDFRTLFEGQETTVVGRTKAGKLLVATTYPGLTEQIKLVRFNADGSPDEAFGSKGERLTWLKSSEARSPALDAATGKMAFIGIDVDDDGNTRNVVSVLRPDGSLDASFDGDGRKVMPPGVYDAELAWQSGRLIIVNQESTSRGDRIVLTRLNGNGTLDTVFGDGGTRVIDDGLNASDNVLDVRRLTDLEFAKAGSSSARN
jgi:uncharacterized delta-60 repeat protein